MSQKVISFHYTLTDDAGTTIDSSRGGEPLGFLTGAQQIVPGLESALLTMKTGDKKKITVAAKEGYGEVSQEMVMVVPRTQFPADLEVKMGDRFRPDASHHAPVFTVVNITDKDITLDGNHPLAGKDLHFDVEITASRDATKEELSHGHAHGGDGHHH